MGAVEVTEITELDAQKVAGVATPANGTPWLLLKAAAEKEDCPTCDGKGKILEGNRKCPDCQGSGEVAAKATPDAESAEADAEEEEVTGSAAKAEESSKKQNDLPDSAFAHIEPGGEKDAEGKTTPRSLRHYPVHDKAHADNANARAEAQIENGGDEAKKIAKAALPKIHAAQKKFGTEAKKGDVQDALNGTATPQEAGHLDTGQSGLAGKMTVGTQILASDSSLALGGQSTSTVPDEGRVLNNPQAPPSTDGGGIVNPQAIKAQAVATLAEAINQIAEGRAAAKDGVFSPPALGETLSPGSVPWESYDAATLGQVAQCLAGCCQAIDCIRDREAIEAVTADPSDQCHVWDLEEAASALEYALGVAARLSFHEAVEGEATKSTEGFAVKVGRILSGKNHQAVVAARDHLQAVIDGSEPKAGDGDSEEDKIVTEVTKDELTKMIAASSVEAVREVLKAERVEAAEKNANNGGDVSEADVKPTSETDADNVSSVGGSVDAEYVNKGDAEGDGVLGKQVADQLEALAKQLGSVEEKVAKIAKRPRAGGPSLDGQLRAPAGELTKGAEDGSEIEKLTKALAEATDPAVKDYLGMQLTRARLTKMHEDGQL